MTRQELIDAGFTIDDGQRPFAYKGPRFNPTESEHNVPTEREEELERAARMALEALEYYDFGNGVPQRAATELRKVLGEQHD